VIWRLYSLLLASEIRENLADASADFEASSLDTQLVWLNAVKQHYGPGTEFLDVTHSPGIAAWFALHRMAPIETQVVYGPPGPFNPRTDVVGAHTFMRYVPFIEAPGYVYVF